MLQAHPSPTAMARVLVQYIDDARHVRSAILSEFNSAPDLVTIRLMRADFLRPGPEPIRFQTQINRHAESMAQSNVAFMRALAAAHPSLIRKVA